ncbi:MAG: pyridoxamine 5'-phosphate oxidase [Phycisphaeraceae bacterium]|nr:pyridoxamine 5'-phosphate oxidase [Phycisphaeraceae bacterium]
MNASGRQRHRPLLDSLTGLVACDDLPEALPADPMPVLTEWFEQARGNKRYDDFNAMALATAAPNGLPSVRIVLCKSIEASPPALVFYTSYSSRKGRELETNPNAAAVFYWSHEKRQARVEGAVVRTTTEESDDYFRTRPLLSRIGATVSAQSQVIESRQRLLADAIRLGARGALRGDIQRPSHWGGYRILIHSVELWSARSGRLHDRARWTRSHDASGWLVRRLGP